MKTTTAYKRLPPDSGTPPFEQQVHLSGFRDIKIQSRVIAERQISDFMKYCERDADQPAARMILGAWGEGKTEAFYRYIKPYAEKHDHNAFLLTSRSIVNAYVHYDGVDTSEARLFLAAVFHVLSDERVVKIPNFTQRAGSFESWIEKCLDDLNCRKKKVFLFIDEVEQLIHEPRDLRRLMLGIKHILDGQFIGLMPGKPFAGSLFIFFACTPEAYNRIATDPDVRQVFGGYGRRMDKINIESISLKESVQFLFELLKYTYDGKLPKPLPIVSPGILTALAIIAKRNMGHMVSLTTRLLSSMKRQDGTLEIIGPEQLLNFAKGRTLNIEGHDTKCFEDDLYQQIIKKIERLDAGSEFFRKLLMSLLFDQMAVTEKDVNAIIEAEIWKGMEKIWMRSLNQVLNELGFPSGLFSFHPINGNLSREAIFENLEAFLDNDKKDMFRFGERLFEVKDIEDLLLQWTITEKGELAEQIIVPSNIETISALFGPLPYDNAEQLLQIFSDLSDKKKNLFRLPKDLIDQAFPPPCPPGLEFIRDAADRFNLWRRATIEYTQRLSQDLPKALAILADSTEKQWRFANIRVKDSDLKIFSATLIYEKDTPQKTVSLQSLVFARSHVDEKDIIQFQKYVKGLEFLPHIVIVLSNDAVDSNIQNKIEPRLRKRTCFITIHPTYAKQMLATFWHIAAGGAIYEDLLNYAKEALLGRDLGLYSQLDTWLSNGRKMGFVVDTPVLSEGTSYRGLVYALRLLLNAEGSRKNLKEIFDWNRNILRSLIPYGTKTGLIPETDRLESFDGFRSLVGDLQTNGFVEIDSENRPLLKLTSCEETILEELSTGDIHKDHWNNHLLILSNPESIVEEVYLDALIQRGLVSRIKGRGRGGLLNHRRTMEGKEVVEEAINSAHEYKKRVENFLKELPSFRELAYLVVAKERDIQVITLEDIIAVIDERLDSITKSKDDGEVRANAVFIHRFIEESGKKIIDGSRIAIKRLQDFSKELQVKYQEYISQKIPTIINDVGTLLNFSVDVSSLKEVSELKDIIRKINETLELADEPTKQPIKDKVSTLSPEELKANFWFNSLDSLENYPHHYHLYTIQKFYDCFQERSSTLDRALKSVTEQIELLQERRNKLYRQIISSKVPSYQIVSEKIHEILRTLLQPKPNSRFDSDSVISIDSIVKLNKLIESRFSQLKSSIISLEQSFESWEQICTEESRYLSELKQTEDIMVLAKNKFNMAEYSNAFKSIEALLTENKEKHKRLPEKAIEVSPETFSEFKRSLNTLAKEVGEIIAFIDSELWEQYLKKRNEFLMRLKKQIVICNQLGINTHSIQKEYNLLNDFYDEGTTLNDFLQNKISCAEEFHKFEQINYQTTDSLNQHLSENEKIVFEKLLESSGKLSSQEGIDLEYLKHILPDSISNELSSVINSLWEKGILSVKLFI
ncbi:MAG: hypothetical protein L6Q29_04090 [Candidatus Pacebacteria bacterium]|nr:hypothetical protein [Candidatus Paceibacterota bacterium]